MMMGKSGQNSRVCCARSLAGTFLIRDDAVGVGGRGREGGRPFAVQEASGA